MAARLNFNSLPDFLSQTRSLCWLLSLAGNDSKWIQLLKICKLCSKMGILLLNISHSIHQNDAWTMSYVNQWEKMHRFQDTYETCGKKLEVQGTIIIPSNFRNFSFNPYNVTSITMGFKPCVNHFTVTQTINKPHIYCVLSNTWSSDIMISSLVNDCLIDVAFFYCISYIFFSWTLCKIFFLLLTTNFATEYVTVHFISVYAVTSTSKTNKAKWEDYKYSKVFWFGHRDD